MSDEPDWGDVRRDYEGSTLRTLEILAKYQISRHALDKRIDAEGWIKRLPAVPRQPTTKKQAARRKAPKKSPRAAVKAKAAAAKSTAIAQRRKILERLHNTIAKRLEVLEARVDADDNNITAADFERESRSISQLIKSLEQATDFHHDQRGKRISGAAAKSASIAATQLADEADRLRRELAERLRRLVDPAGE